MDNGIPITERVSEITETIDVSSPSGIVQLLQQCDAQIFTGWQQFESLYHAQKLETVAAIAAKAVSVLQHKHGCVVLSGCGTSGRIAFATSRSFNRICKDHGQPQAFTYTIAGGDRALFLSTEAPEDSWSEGVSSLLEVTKGKERVLFVGITCGLSAPFVAGQLQYCLDHPEHFTPVLLGFNPVKMSRRTPVMNWDKTFLDVAEEMERRARMGNNCFVLNPVVGPEAITGSSRMKGGSATKILLETIFSLTVQLLISNPPQPPIELSVSGFLMAYEQAYRSTYLNITEISKLVAAAGKTLCSEGRICYLSIGSLGCLCMIDASECPPTYGSAFDDVRGFCLNGWDCIGNNEGSLTHRGREYHISWAEFQTEILPQLSVKDTVILVLLQEETELPAVLDMKRRVELQCERVWPVYLVIDGSSFKASDAVSISLNTFALQSLINLTSQKLCADVVSMVGEMAIKWVLNAITTGAHVMKGKVLKNSMIDMQVSNTKLYYRAVSIIKNFAEVESSIAENKLLSVIYDSDELPQSISTAPVVSHIERATGQSMVVPTAILLAKGFPSVSTAREILKKTPVVRYALQQDHVPK